MAVEVQVAFPEAFAAPSWKIGSVSLFKRRGMLWRPSPWLAQGFFLPTCGSFEVAIWCRNLVSAGATTLASSLTR